MVCEIEHRYMMEALDEKLCRRCGTIKSFSLFSKRADSKDDGLQRRCKECVRQNYQQNKASINASCEKHKRAYDEKHPEKKKAWNALNNAVASGKIIKPTACSHCENQERIVGHHEDYSKPLDVIWLCEPCHVEHHHRLTF